MVNALIRSDKANKAQNLHTTLFFVGGAAHLEAALFCF
jgi:hypothetical protein